MTHLLYALNQTLASSSSLWAQTLHLHTVWSYIQSTYTTGEVVKRNVDRRMKIGYNIRFYEHDDDTSKHFSCHPFDHKEHEFVLNLNNYSKDGVRSQARPRVAKVHRLRNK
jgi:hypothetical protein